MNENFIKKSILAQEILNLCRTSVLMNMRFMGTALNRLKMQIYDGTMETDGNIFYYAPDFIIGTYKKSETLPTRNYMHMILHCIFRHMITGEIDRIAWDTACDIAVENIMNSWDMPIFDSDRINAQKKFISEISKYVDFISAEKLYHYFTENNYSEEKLIETGKIFMADSHDLWYNKSDVNGSGGGDSDENDDSDSNENSSDNSGGNSSENGDNNKNSESNNQNSQNNKDKQQTEQMWKDISEKIQLDLETFSKKKGDEAGAMMMNLKEVNRERYDYASFLRKFAVLGEKMVINDEEFDYNFYTYGLKLYKNMPLIEPLEYKEVKSIREFVIAIDTSGSVAGDEVQSFVTKTYNIMKQQENFFRRINIHIIQCDAQIQEDAVITSQEEFDEYIKNMTLKGFGGTDFRPVFDYVDKLIENKVFSNLKGLIYFTDGYGDFPKHKPPYEAAFVFVRDDTTAEPPAVPPWAIKLVLSRDDIKLN